MTGDKQPDTKLDVAMTELAERFAAGFSALSSSPIFRPFVVEAAIMHAAMALEDAFPDRHDEIKEALADQAAITGISE